MDEALVSSTQRLRIRRSNLRLPSDIQSKESTLQLVYDVLRRCPFFKAFLVTADVPENSMQEFWATAYVHQQSIRFKINNKKLIVSLESFREMLHICPRIHGQSFDELPFEEEILDFIRFLGHSATIRTLTDININKLYQPWRSFAAIFNKCLIRKSSGYSFQLSQAQILWGLYHKRNIDYAFLIKEDFVYQVEHKNHKKSNEMYYPRFTKVIIHHFMSKDASIQRRNKINWHYVRDESIFSMIKVVSRHKNTQQYGAMLPIELTNDEIRNTKAYKEYCAFATGEAVPKPKASARRKRSDSDTSITPPATTTPKPTVVVTPRLAAGAKGKQTAKSLPAPLEVARTEAQQLKIILRRRRQQTHISQPGGSGTDEGTGLKPGVPNVPTDESKEELSWNSSDDEENQETAKYDKQDDAEGGGDDKEEGEGDEEDDNEETREEESFNPIPKTPEGSKDKGDGEEDQILKISEEERLNEEEEADELYRDVDINQGRGLQVNQEVKDSHMTLTLINFDGQQESLSVSSQFVTNMLNPTSDAGMESIFATASTSVAPFPITAPTMTPSTVTTITTTSQSVNAQLEAEVLTKSFHSSRTSYTVVADLSEMELKKILIKKMEGNKSIQCSDEQRNLYKALVDAYEADKIILDSYGETVILKRRRDDDDDQDEGPSAGSDRGSKRRREGAEDQPIIQSSQHPEWFSQSKKPPTPDRDWNKTLPAIQGSTQTWISELAKQADSRSSFNELLDTPLDFFNFIMNRLRGGTFSRKYTTSVMKTKAAYYGQIKWIKDLVPRTMWIQEPVDYDKHALWEVSHWYGFVVNRLSALYVYSNRRIIAFKDDDFKRLRLQEIEDMLLLLVQGKLTNLTIEERFAFNVSLRVFTRSIVIQRRVEDLQLGVKSYQKRLNLTKPDTYRFDLKQREAYTAYSNLRGFIYQNKDKKNRLMRIDELHKFSDETLNDVRTALDDRLKGIRMQYLPQTMWRKGDKDRAAAMIQAIDKMLKTRRIIRSLEKFVGGRLYEGDF
nr:hypothetical protein [Tanacetum cinerariifolium]